MGKHFNSKHDDAAWRALFGRWHAGEACKALKAEAGVSSDTWRANAKRLGMRLCDLPADHPGRRRAPPFEARPDDWKHQNSLLDEGGWRELFRLRAVGVPDTVLSERFGVHAATICTQAAKRGWRREDLRRASDEVVGAEGEVSPLHRFAVPLPAERGGDEGGVGDPRLAVAIDPKDAAATRASFEAVIVSAGALGDYRTVTAACRTKEAVEKSFFASGGYRPSGCLSPPNPPGCEDGEAGEAAAAPLELRPAQRAPDGDWSTWLFLGGRGAGKTLAGAMWLADQAEALGAGGRLALIGPTLHDVREVMVEGASGIVSLPRWQGGARPVFEPSRRRLVFPNGAVAQAFSAEDPDSLRGPQFAAAWADEFCAWRKGGETLALLRMGLRLPLRPSTAPRSPSPRCGEETEGGGSVSSPSPCDGEGDPEGVEGRSQPRLCVTTTPRPSAALRRLRGEPGCVETHATTRDNAANLSAGFVEGLERLYGGTRKAAQELEGKVVEQEGALFTAEMMMRARSPSPPRGGWSRSDRVGAADEADGGAPTLSPLRADIPPRGGEGEAPYDRIVVAVDPTTTAGGNACGIVVAGRRGDRAVVLADWSKAGLSPDGWARRAVRAAEAFGAHAIVAEVNQGGEMVRAVLKAAGCAVRLREVRATKGKRVRAEPVAALYEQGRVVHAGDFAALEEELMALGGEEEAGSDLDRADALVWAVTDLLIDRARSGEYGPRVSVLGGPVVRTGLSARAW